MLTREDSLSLFARERLYHVSSIQRTARIVNRYGITRCLSKFCVHNHSRLPLPQRREAYKVGQAREPARRAYLMSQHRNIQTGCSLCLRVFVVHLRELPRKKMTETRITAPARWHRRGRPAGRCRNRYTLTGQSLPWAACPGKGALRPSGSPGSRL